LFGSVVVLIAGASRSALASPPGNWTFCANEGQTCNVNYTEDVAFGADSGTYTVLEGVVTSILCAVGSFDNVDPAPGASKACYVPANGTSGPDGWVACANENGTCNFSGTKWVAFGHKNRFGAVNGFMMKDLTGPVSCTTATFGHDPASGVAKACFIPGPGHSNLDYFGCANEGQTCLIPGGRTDQLADVSFGSGLTFLVRPGQPMNGFSCTTSFFGYDPTPGVAKICAATFNSGPGGMSACAVENGNENPQWCGGSAGFELGAFGRNGYSSSRTV